jgi:C-terminal processing protease CtpA/Prc
MNEVEKIYAKYYKVDMILELIKESQNIEFIKDIVSEDNGIENLLYILCNNIFTSKYMLYRRKNEKRLSVSEYLGIRTDIVGINKLIVMDMLSEHSGLKVGDIIVKINDKSPLEYFEPNYTDLKIDVLRFDISHDKYITSEIILPCSNIDDITLDTQFSENYINLSTFDDEYNLKKFLDSASSAITIDLRNNLGGSVENMIKTLEYFLPCNTVVAYIKEKGKLKELTTNYEHNYKISKINILTSGITSSSAEIFIVAMKKYLNVDIIGDCISTYGKEYIQNYYYFDDDSYIALPVYEIYTIDKAKLTKGTIKVDLLLSENEINQRYVNI